MDNPEKLASYGTKDEETQNTLCVGHHYAQTNTNNVIKIWVVFCKSLFVHLYFFFWPFAFTYLFFFSKHFPPSIKYIVLSPVII